MNLKYFLFVVCCFGVIFYAGCSKKNGMNKNSDIASIDNYNINVGDYNFEKQKFYPYFENTEQSKKEIVDILIDNTVLLKEAAKANINSDPDFLKSIEHFWRQSLIQQLLNKKISLIRQNTKISEKELKTTYEKLKDNYLIRVLGYKKAQEVSIPDEINKLDLYVDKNKELFSLDTGWYWTDIFNLPLEIFSYFKINSVSEQKWITLVRGSKKFTFFIKEVKQQKIDDYGELKEEIENFLRNNKEQRILDEWIKSLRTNSKVIINEELLSKL